MWRYEMPSRVRTSTAIRHAAATGALRARKRGTRTIIPREDLIEWLKSLPERSRKPQIRAVSANAVTDHVSGAADRMQQGPLEALVDLGAQP